MALSQLDRRIAALAIPALGTLAIEPLYVLVDTAIVGRLGTVPLGGLALASTVLTTLLWAFNFLSFGTTARVAFLTGRDDAVGAAGVAAQGLWLSGVIGIPLALFVGFGGHAMAAGLGGQGDVLEAATTYLRISAIGVPAVLIALVGQGHLRGLSDTRTPLAVVLVANLLNVALELILVYGFHLGIAGSAWGTVAAQLVAAAWFVVLTGRRVAAAGAPLGPNRKEMANLVVIGRHLFVRTGALLATLAIATSVAARVSQATLAGHQIALQIETFLALSLDALAIAAQAMVGTMLGGGRAIEARDTGRRLLTLGLGAGIILAVVVVALSPVIPHIFTADPAVLHRAMLGLIVVGVLQIPGSVAYTLDGVLMGASDFRFLQWAVVLSGLAFLPMAAAVLHWPSLGIVGVWCGLLVWMTVRAGFNLGRFSSDRWTVALLGSAAGSSH